jgi:hypothetical protein
MGHLLGGFNNKPFHILERHPVISKEEILNVRGHFGQNYNAKTRSRNLSLIAQPASPDVSGMIRSGTFAPELH